MTSNSCYRRKPICYHGPHEVLKIRGRPQKIFNSTFWWTRKESTPIVTFTWKKKSDFDFTSPEIWVTKILRRGTISGREGPMQPASRRFSTTGKSVTVTNKNDYIDNLHRIDICRCLSQSRQKANWNVNSGLKQWTMRQKCKFAVCYVSWIVCNATALCHFWLSNVVDSHIQISCLAAKKMLTASSKIC